MGYGRTQSEYYVSRDTKAREEELKKNPIDPDQPVWEGGDPKELALSGAKGAAKWGATGAEIGFYVGGVPGAAVGGALGLAAGLVGGTIMGSREQMASFQESVEAFKIKTAAAKEKAKMALAAGREALRSAKQARGKTGRAPDLQPITEVDRDIMAMTGGYPTQYGRGMAHIYGQEVDVGGLA